MMTGKKVPPGLIAKTILEKKPSTPKEIYELIQGRGFKTTLHSVQVIFDRLRRQGAGLPKARTFSKITEEGLAVNKQDRIAQYVFSLQRRGLKIDYGAIAAVFGVKPGAVKRISEKAPGKPVIGKHSKIELISGRPVSQKNVIRKAILAKPRTGNPEIAKQAGATAASVAWERVYLRNEGHKLPILPHGYNTRQKTKMPRRRK